MLLFKQISPPITTVISMLSPIVYCKVVHARNAYLRAGKKEMPVKREHLLEMAMERHDLYKHGGRPHDSERVLTLATTKEHATLEEQARLERIVKKIQCLTEQTA